MCVMPSLAEQSAVMARAREWTQAPPEPTVRVADVKTAVRDATSLADLVRRLEELMR